MKTDTDNSHKSTAVKAAMSCPPRRSRGQSAVEFALIASVLFLFIYGIMEVGRLVFINSAVENGAREGARYASANPSAAIANPRPNPDALRTAVVSRMALVDGSQVTINVQPGPICDFCPITVTVSYPWQTLVSMVNLGPLTLESRSIKLIENAR